MQRIDRLDLLTRLLRDRPGITVTALARDLGVSERSVFRDLDHLRDRGLPIEALCTLLSLAISEKLSFPMFSSEVSRARKKIVDAFPAIERKRIAPLRERVFIGRPASANVAGSYAMPDAGVMRRLQVAFVRESTVRADYLKETGELSNRRVEPHAMLINWPAWYLLGFDHLRGEPRTFRFDRFRAVEIEEHNTFKPRPRDFAERFLCETRFRMEPV